MANMSYCRFENTLKDLRDCARALDAGDEPETESERRAKRSLIKLCGRIAEDHGDDGGSDGY